MCSFLRTSVRADYSNVVVGDFNMPNVDWVLNTASGANQVLFFECVSDLGMSQYVTEPTRGDNTLDLILSDCDRLIYKVSVREHFGGSDHNMVEFWIQGHVIPLSKKDQSHGILNFDKLRELLRMTNWPAVMNRVDDVNELWTCFATVLKSCVHDCTVFRNTNSYRKAPLPKSLIRLRKRKLKLWRSYKKNKTQFNHDCYRECQKLYSKAVQESEVKAEQDIIREGNLSALYRFVKRKTGCGRTIPPLTVGNDTKVDNSEKANILNDIFSSNFIADNGVMPSIQSVRNPASCKHPVFSPKVVLESLGSLRGSHAVGPDGYSATFYKEIKNEICAPLAEIFALSLKSGKLPDIWKTARVTPIFKKGDASNPSNYRPIALTCVPCKVMEKIIRTSMLSFVQEHSLLSKDQFGFIPRRSTCLQLLSVLDDWTNCLDMGIPVDTILVDFAKAFESVVHTKLLGVLDHYGFRGLLLDWLGDFLQDRTQRVVVGDATSYSAKVTSGVPQGSVLGPLLFVLFLNNLTIQSNDVNLNKFADDVEMHAPIVGVDDGVKLSNAVSDLKTWSVIWQLPVAPNKCNVFHIGSQNPFFKYSLSPGTHLPSVTMIKDLGVWFSSDLSFSIHCNNIVKLAKQRAALIRKVFTSGDRATLVWAFKTYVRPILEYASPVWSPCRVGLIKLIETVQRNFTRFLPGCRDLSYADRLKFAGLDSLELRRMRADLCLTFSLLNDLVDFDYSNFFELRNSTRTRGHPLKLIVPGSKRDCRKHFFANRVVNVWNDLPDELVTAPSLGSFKTKLASVNLTKHLLCF